MTLAVLRYTRRLGIADQLVYAALTRRRHRRVHQPALYDLLAATAIFPCSFCCDGAPSPTTAASRSSSGPSMAAPASSRTAAICSTPRWKYTRVA